MTLRDRLQARIDAEQAELERIRRDTVTNSNAAAARIALLTAARDALTPELETLIDKLSKIGVKVIE
jgi:hypothetical protein